MTEQDFKNLSGYRAAVARSKENNPMETEEMFHHYNACSELAIELVGDLESLSNALASLAADYSCELPDFDDEPDDVRVSRYSIGVAYAGDCLI